MKSLKIAGIFVVGQLLTAQQVFAQVPCEEPCGTAVPEMDGSGAIIALGLVIGLVAIVRERYFPK